MSIIFLFVAGGKERVERVKQPEDDLVLSES